MLLNERLNKRDELNKLVHIKLINYKNRKTLGEFNSTTVSSMIRNNESFQHFEKKYFIKDIEITTPYTHGLGVYITLIVIPL